MPTGQSSKRLKVLYVITQGELGGAQRYVLDLTKALDKTKYEVIAAMGPEKLELKNQLEAVGVPVKLLEHLRRSLRPSHDLLAILELKNLIEREKPDLVHLNSSKAGFLGSLAARLAGVKNVIFTAHGFAFLEPHNWFVRRLYFWAEKIATYFRRKIICVSEFDRQAAIQARMCSSEKLVTIHNGISPINVIASASEAIPSNGEIASSRPGGTRNDNEIIIGTIANLYPTKGIKYLIDAAHLLDTKYEIRNTRYLIIGEGSERSYLESRIKNYGLQDKFLLVGAKKDAGQYLSQFDIFVLPSLKEGFPYTILEAMAQGLPIVATSVGGVPEMITPYSFPSPGDGEGKGEVEANGLLVPPKNPQALAEAIIKLIQNPELAKTLGARARARVKEFSLEQMVRATEEVYKKL